MNMADPSKRWNTVLAAAEGKNVTLEPLTQRVLDVYTGKSHDADIEYAISLILEQTDRDSVVAYLLSGASFAEISASLRITPVRVIEIFSQLYMDVTIFRDKLAHLRYSEYYLEKVCPIRDTRNQALIRQGISHGPRALDIWWMRGGDTLEIDRNDIANSMVRLAFTNAMAAKNVSITSAVAKEAHRWVKTAMDAVELRDSTLRGDGRELDAVLAIQQHIATKKPNDLGVTLDEILH